MHNMLLFIIFHVVGDFHLQSDEVAKNKENLNTIYGIDANLTISEDGKYPICMEYDLFRGINEK